MRESRLLVFVLSAARNVLNITHFNRHFLNIIKRNVAIINKK